MPGIFHQAGCCCGGGEPCTDCGYNQPTIPAGNISVSGTCSGSTCHTADDHDYSFLTFNADECRWSWENNSDSWGLEIIYHCDEDRWEAALWYWTPPLNWNGSDFYGGNVSGITCNPNTHHLEGTFSLDGQLSEHGQDCRGCTVTITLTG